jgi:hypothetical protein
MTRDAAKTWQLLDEEAKRERRERERAEDATDPREERAALRRADKAGYLRRKLREREASER